VHRLESTECVRVSVPHQTAVIPRSSVIVAEWSRVNTAGGLEPLHCAVFGLLRGTKARGEKLKSAMSFGRVY
jgi:hypothetical protein